MGKGAMLTLTNKEGDQCKNQEVVHKKGVVVI